jgi:hypothetical protein
VLSSVHTLIAVTASDQREHLIEERVLAASRNGRYIARCGAIVVSASMTAQPGKPCLLCAPPLEPSRHQESARRFRSRRRGRPPAN